MSSLVASINEAECIGCGLCADTCPEVFNMKEDRNVASVIVEHVPDEAIDACHDAVDSCPTSVISISE